MDERIRALFLSQMGLLVKQRKEPFGLAVGTVKGEMSALGLLRSGRAALVTRREYEQEYNEFCEQAWSRLSNIALTIGVEPGDQLATELRAVFDEVLVPRGEELLNQLRSDKTILDKIRDPIFADASDAFSTSRDLIGTEIDLLANSATIGSGAEPKRGESVYYQNYHFQGPVGAVQSGETVSATVTQQIDTGAASALRDALSALQEQVAEREDATQIIAAAQQELSKTKPDRGRLERLLTGIGSVVSTIAKAGEAYKVVKAAAVALGITI